MNSISALRTYLSSAVVNPDILDALMAVFVLIAAIGMLKLLTFGLFSK